jgi:hypothetical protein
MENKDFEYSRSLILQAASREAETTLDQISQFFNYQIIRPISLNDQLLFMQVAQIILLQALSRIEATGYPFPSGLDDKLKELSPKMENWHDTIIRSLQGENSG